MVCYYDGERAVLVGPDPDIGGNEVVRFEVSGRYLSVPSVKLLTEGEFGHGKLGVKGLWVHVPNVDALEDLGDRTRVTMSGWSFETPMVCSDVIWEIEMAKSDDKLVLLERIL